MRIIAATAVVAVLVSLTVVLWGGGASARTVAADFPRTVGLFVGSEVRIMGMKVGTVKSITPHGTYSHVVMSYDGSLELPADVKAAIVSPSVISDRFVQLAPGYVSGPTMGDGATIPTNRTAIPVELDDSLATTTQLAQDLGPNGANKDGALNSALRALAGVLDGNGTPAHVTLHQLSLVSDTLAANAPQLAATLGHLAHLTGALQAHNDDVVSFNTSLADISHALASDSGDLSALLSTLATTLGTVTTFVAQNRSSLATDVHRLASVAATLAGERNALAEIADIAPIAFQNLDETYDPQAQAVRTRANLSVVITALNNAVCDAMVKQAGASILPVCQQTLRLVLGAAK
ncbi:MCE family protein [Nocardioides baekrokdamisoli]|nr:MCE family protein [Nocardioides baekrokdamisoli]